MTSPSVEAILRQLPSVDALLQLAPLQDALTRHPRKLVVASIRHILEKKRRRLTANPDQAHLVELGTAHLAELILDHLEASSAYTLQSLVNATGVIIHTNLGRSLLPREAVDRLQQICRTYSNLEYDLEQGQRGSRYSHAEAILRELTGAEAALVVNNNAGAVLLALNTLAKDREVVVSRGQLVEIGGSFRIPDVMRSSGAILRDVGCTNRTHVRDYEAAINEQTALLMKVHCSNYRIIGFTTEVALPELVALGHQHGLPVIEDLGSGSFLDFSEFGLGGEPTVQDAVRSGTDLVTFSGDKLLGGPQAGIIVGRQDLVARCKKNPLTRALRVDKMTLAALESVLRLYRDERQALRDIPTLRMISAPLAELEQRAHELAALIRDSDTRKQLDLRVAANASQVGGGSLPGQSLPTHVVSIHSAAISTQELERLLRGGNPPVIGRIEADQLLLDVRTLQEGDFTIIRDAFVRILGNE